MRTRSIYECKTTGVPWLYYCADSKADCIARLKADDPVWTRADIKIHKVHTMDGRCGLLPRKGFVRAA